MHKHLLIMHKREINLKLDLDGLQLNLHLNKTTTKYKSAHQFTCIPAVCKYFKLVITRRENPFHDGAVNSCYGTNCGRPKVF